MWRLKPDLLIELGTAGGGSAVYYATIMTAYNKNAHVITIDPMRKKLWNWRQVHKVCKHCIDPKETPIWKSSTIEFYHEPPAKVVNIIHRKISEWQSNVVMVIEDSNHHTESVLNNLGNFSQFVTPGSYFIVQDIKMLRLMQSKKISPSLAINMFLNTTAGASFEIDRTFEYYFYTQHPKGFLKRKH